MNKRILSVLLILVIISAAVAFWLTRTETQLIGFDTRDGDVLFSAEIPNVHYGGGAAIGSNVYLLGGDERLTLYAYDLIEGLQWSWQPTEGYSVNQSIHQVLYTDWRHVYVSLVRADSADSLIAIDRRTGAVAWEVEREWNIRPLPKSSEIDSTEEVFIYFNEATTGQTQLVAVDLESGQPRWEVDLTAWISIDANTPLLATETSIWVATEERVETFRTATGERLWTQETGLILGLNGGGDALIVTEPSRVRAFDPASGTELWQMEAGEQRRFRALFRTATRAGSPRLYIQEAIDGLDTDQLQAFSYPDRQLQWEQQVGDIFTNETIQVVEDGVIRLHNQDDPTLTFYAAEDGRILWEVDAGAPQAGVISAEFYIFLMTENTRWNFWRMGN